MSDLKGQRGREPQQRAEATEGSESVYFAIGNSVNSR